MRVESRDLEIIEFLRENGWALSSQVARKFFGSRRHCANRMRTLRAAGVVDVIRMSRFKERYWHERAVLRLMPGEANHAHVYSLSDVFINSLGKRWRKPRTQSMLAHQVMLLNVRERLEAVFPEATSVTEASESLSVLLSNLKAKDVPDLVLTIGTKRFAIELERKGRRGLHRYNFAYEDRFQNLSLRYDAVLYVVEDEDAIHALAKRAEGLRRVGICSLVSLKEVFRLGRTIVPVRSYFSEFLEQSESSR